MFIKTCSYSFALLLFLQAQPISHAADWGGLWDKAQSIGGELLKETPSNSSHSLNNSTLIAGLKEALDIGAQQAISQVGQSGGYLNNDLIRIPMPPQFQQVSGLMKKIGLSSQVEQFEQSLNRAAEQAAPQAMDIMATAIRNMSIDDATAIFNGPDDAATTYFKTQTSDQLTQLFKPTIDASLQQTGSTRYYNQISDQVAAVPIVGEHINVDLADYVTQQALDGLFAMIALEEQKIRANPAARTTELLKQVFGQ